MKRTRGYVEDRGNGTYLVRVYTGRDATGKKTYAAQTVHGTVKEANAVLDDLLTKHARGTLQPAVKVRMGDYLQAWLARREPTLRPKTLDNYQRTIHGHLIPALGTMRLDQITAGTLEDYLAAKAKAGLKPLTVRTQFLVLRAAMHDAARSGAIDRDPCSRMRRGAVPTDQDERPVLTAAQVVALLDEAKRSSPYASLYLAACTTGMRQGELLGLTWKDVDLIAGTIHVQRSLQRINGHVVTGKPKTKKGDRTVWMVEDLQNELARMKADADPVDSALIFCQTDGAPLHAHNIMRRDFKPLLTRAGLPAIHFHDLRHTVATLQLANGTPVKDVQALMGHANARITLDLYGHALPEGQAKAAKTLERVLAGKVAA